MIIFPSEAGADPKLLIAFIGLAGALIGGLVQSIGSWILGHRQFVRDSRSKDYELFIQAVAEMSQAKDGSAERTTATAKMIEGRAKILLHGSAKVIRALERQASHLVLATEQSYADFCSLALEMRKDVGGKSFEDFPQLARSIVFGDSIDGKSP